MTTPTTERITETERDWIVFCRSIGKTYPEISESLGGKRTAEHIESFCINSATEEAIAEARTLHSNRARKAPKYPYNTDERPAGSSCTEEALAVGRVRVDEDTTIDTKISWDGIGWSLQEQKYLFYILQHYVPKEDAGNHMEVLAYYQLFTPRSAKEVFAWWHENSEYIGDFAESKDCPYAFSFESYLEAGYWKRPSLSSELVKGADWAKEKYLAGLSRTSNKTLINTEQTRGWIRDLMLHGMTVTQVYDMLNSNKYKVDSRKPTSGVVGAAAQGITDQLLTPKGKGTLEDICERFNFETHLEARVLSNSTQKFYLPRRANWGYKDSYTFHGFDDKEYTVYPWLTVNIQKNPNKHEKSYLRFLLSRYPQKAVYDYILLYSPRKSGQSLVEEYRRQSPIARYTATIDCPYPVPFEAVYDADHEHVVRYEELKKVQDPAKKVSVATPVADRPATVKNPDQGKQAVPGNRTPVAPATFTDSRAEQEQAYVPPTPTVVASAPRAGQFVPVAQQVQEKPVPVMQEVPVSSVVPAVSEPAPVGEKVVVPVVKKESRVSGKKLGVLVSDIAAKGNDVSAEQFVVNVFGTARDSLGALTFGEFAEWFGLPQGVLLEHVFAGVQTSDLAARVGLDEDVMFLTGIGLL